MQVRIQVVAASINFADALQLQGLYQEKPKLPFIPGSEVSGRVLEIGNDVRTVAVGDAVRLLPTFPPSIPLPADAHTRMQCSQS